MSDELRELLNQHAIYQEELYEEIMSWHIRERRKWAMEKLPKKIEPQGDVDMEGNPVQLPLTNWEEGYNFCRPEILKKIEESE